MFALTTAVGGYHGGSNNASRRAHIEESLDRAWPRPMLETLIYWSDWRRVSSNFLLWQTAYTELYFFHRFGQILSRSTRTMPLLHGKRDIADNPTHRHIHLRVPTDAQEARDNPRSFYYRQNTCAFLL
jgi:hypothetical protein